MHILVIIVLTIFSFALLWCAYHLFKKGWQTPFSITLILAVIVFLSAFGWFQGFFKTGVVALLIQKVEQFGTTLDKYNTTTEKLREEIVAAQNELDAHQKQIQVQQHNHDLALKSLTDLATEIGSNQLEVAKQNKAIADAQATIEAQQERLSDVERITDQILAGMTMENYLPSDRERILIGRKDNGGLQVILATRLEPYFQSLKIQRGQESLMAGTYHVSENIITTEWETGVDPNELRKSPWSVFYISQKPSQAYPKRLSVNAEGLICVDGKPLAPPVHSVDTNTKTQQ